MNKSALRSVRITGGFWGKRLEMNARKAIFYQWQQLERTRCIDNFRIAAGQIEGFREGMFFADSDAYKWLDAAARILSAGPDPLLERQVDAFIALLEAAQTDDGYLYTYNQILFPGQLWVNLQLEHELYCLGHLIEAGVAHYAATGETRLLNLVRRSADLLVRDFMDAAPDKTDGHEEIEIALIRLYRVTGDASYLELARRWLERRGRIRGYPLLLLPQLISTARRMRSVSGRRKLYVSQHPEHAGFHLPAHNTPKVPRLTWLRLIYDLLSGKNFQQNAPLRRQVVAVGHAVRFTYLETAAAMLCRETNDADLLSVLERAWDHMVTRHMYVTGGLGSLPLIEGFGHDYELDPEVAYAETCAAIGSLFWNHEMALLTGRPRYDDLFEWQLYNAAGVGIGIDGCSYFYNNPLACRGGISRAPWFLVPCCPSNLSRTWAALGQYAYRADADEIHLSQYVTSAIELDWGRLEVDSGLPWSGDVRLSFDLSTARLATLDLRLPAWSGAFELHLNGSPLQPDSVTDVASVPATACGFAPHAARVAAIRRVWQPGDVLDLTLDMPIRLHRQHEKVRGCGGMDALSRGPLVYCLESVDNQLDLFSVVVERDSFKPVYDESLLGGAWKIEGRRADGTKLIFIPYMLWGNRGPSQMTVFFKTG
ncbi:MAG: glycoside hydrolase family 127 protein [Deltaproteobacteria bacterium]|nr:glycoside hydrolase family 127 protein [Deltaproteobacteria bacterium]